MEALTQDNEDPFQPLGLAAARLVEDCEKQQKHRERDTARQRAEEEKAEDRRKAVENGLRQIERFERRYRRGDRS